MDGAPSGADEPEAPADAGPEVPERPAPDKLDRAMARSRIAGRLFATTEVVTVGRYQLLEKVGAGGMGVVWGAWDPELERRVAIKLLAAERASARERILAEGQALAKLSHPNVVPVFDVGVVDERVYLVMEWVRGQNVRAWCAEEPRSVREIVGVYREAGAGLAAAHAAGLVHRDFKPDNAVVGEDGRVRVLDFGLARSELLDETGGDERATRGAGTPRYMAPEQAEGRELTSAADQYAFGVSLREAVSARGEVPAWIAAIVARATKPVPAERFPSMAALLDALARDPRTVWRRRLGAAAIVGVAGGAFAIGSLRDDQAERCTGGRADIAATWGPTQRDPLLAKLRLLGAYGEVVANQIGPELDAYGERWVLAQRGACIAADEGELPRTQYEQSLGCLARARTGLAAARDVLTRVDVSRLPDALVAARSLPDPARCRLDAQTSTVPPPPLAVAARVAEVDNDVARARVLGRAIEPGAVELAATTERAAAALGYGPLTARAALVYGAALSWDRQRGEAMVAFDRAQALAFAAGDHVTGVEAVARELFAVATTGGPFAPEVQATLESTRLVEHLASGLGPTGAFARALLLNNLGTLALSDGDRTAARRYFESALATRGPVMPDTYELSSIPGNLGLVEDDPVRRTALFAQERAELAAVVGDDHPQTLEIRAKTAAYAPDAVTASRELRDMLDRVQQFHPHLTEKFSSLAYDLVFLTWDAGDKPGARAATTVASSELDKQLATSWQLLLDGRLAEAAAHAHAHADELLATDRGWNCWRALDALIVEAAAERESGHAEQARAAAERGLATAQLLPSFAGTAYYKLRVARFEALRQ